MTHRLNGYKWGFSRSTIDAAMSAFYDDVSDQSLLRCGPGRSNVTIRAYGDQESAPILDGSGGGMHVAVRGAHEWATIVEICPVGLLLDTGHSRVNVSGISFRNFYVGIDACAGSLDVFHRLQFDGGTMRVAISLQPDKSKLEYWDQYFYTEDSAGNKTYGEGFKHLIRSYPTAETDYSRQILVGFCSFQNIGADLVGRNTSVEPLSGASQDTLATGLFPYASQGAMAVGLAICTTEVCVNHCTFDRCQDCVTGTSCSTGHLIFCNSFRYTLYGGKQDFYWEDGNGIDLINAAPRTPTAWTSSSYTLFDDQPPKIVQVPKQTAIFTNLFYHCQNSAIILHFCARCVDIFNNYFVGIASGVPMGGSAVVVSGDILSIVRSQDMDNGALDLGGGQSLADRIFLETGYILDKSANAAAAGTTHLEDALVAGSTGPLINVCSIRVYRNIVEGGRTALGGVAFSNTEAVVLDTEDVKVSPIMDDLWVVNNTIVDCTGYAVAISNYPSGIPGGSFGPEGSPSELRIGFYNNAFRVDDPGYWTPAIYCNQKPEEAGDTTNGRSPSSWFEYVVLDGNAYESSAQPGGAPDIFLQVNFRQDASLSGYLPLSWVQDYCWNGMAERSLYDRGFYPVYTFSGSEEELFSGVGDAYRKYRPDREFLAHGFWDVNVA